MSRKHKTSYKMYAAWDYEQELEELNRLSREGWQLVRGGCFSCRFRWNPNMCYRYQLDFQHSIEDRGRYFETFREQGWEYVNSSFNGWNYFRKPVDPALSEEDYEIFTDRPSLEEMNRRWTRVGLISCALLAVGVVVELIFAITAPQIPTFVRLAVLLFELGVILGGVLCMKKPERRKRRRSGGHFALFLLVLILGMCSALWLSDRRADFHTEYRAETVNAIPAEPDKALVWQSVEIKYRDFYRVELEVRLEAPLRFCIINTESGAVLASEMLVPDESRRAELCLRLSPEAGHYAFCFYDYPGGLLNFDCTLD